MLVVGVVLGVVLGPAVLGRLAPDQYDKLFVGSGDTSAIDKAEQDIAEFDAGSAEHLARVAAIMAQYNAVGEPGDSTMVAAEEQIDQINAEREAQREALGFQLALANQQVQERRDAYQDKLGGMATVMLLLLVCVFAAESILSPERDDAANQPVALPPVLSRLVTVRYALAAGWLMLMLAQPVWLRGIDAWFGVVLLGVVLVAGLMPLGKRA